MKKAILVSLPPSSGHFLIIITLVEFTYEKDPEKCEIDNFASIWNELTGKNLSGSDTDFTNLPRKLSKALSLITKHFQ